MYLNANDISLDGLGKSKKGGFKKLLQSKPKILKKLFKTSPLMMPITMMKKGKKKRGMVAPAVAEPVTFLPVSPIQEQPEYIERPELPYQEPYEQPRYIGRPQSLPQFIEREKEQESVTVLPADYFPTELEFDDSLPEPENTPLITPYESAVASQYGSEEGFMDTSAAYESEAGYLQGLGQEAGSTGGWFTDLISQGAKAAIEVQRAKAAAKRGGFPAPIIGTGTYRPLTAFGGFNLNTALMIGGLGLAAFLIFQRTSKAKR